MYRIICVTNRHLCTEPLPVRAAKIAAARPAGIIVREKDLDEEKLSRLVLDILEPCTRYGIPLYVAGNVAAAQRCSVGVQLSMPLLRMQKDTGVDAPLPIGASVHSVEEAREAEQYGASHLVAGHIFPTDCKHGVPARGTGFLREICSAVRIPVYAIGGITPQTVGALKGIDIAGVCVMSALMTCDEPKAWLDSLREAWMRGAD